MFVMCGVYDCTENVLFDLTIFIGAFECISKVPEAFGLPF